MYKLGAKLGAKLGLKPVTKPDAKPGTFPDAKLSANYTVNCGRFRKRTQKMPKVAPTHEIAPFCPKNEEKCTKRWSRCKKGCKK